MVKQITRVVAPVRQQAVEILRQAIADHVLRPGMRLIERDLCETLQVSRAALREGLRQLEAEGLLTRDARGRLIVAPITLEQARGIYETRAALEGLAGRLFAERASDEEIAKLRETFDLLEEAAHEDTLSRFLQVKDGFYEILLNGCRNDELRTLLNLLYWRITLLRVTSLSEPGRLEQCLEEFRRIVEAAECRDASALERCCIAHVDCAREAALRILEKRLATSPDGVLASATRQD